jgi:hypothetical protein
MLKYLATHAHQESQRPLGDFRGIAPHLLEGQDPQAWVNQQREEWAERENLWKSAE